MKNFSKLYVLLAAVLWGILGIFVRNLESLSFSSIDTVAIRCIGSAAGLFIYSLLFRRAALKIKLADLWVFLGTGICSVAFFNVCYFYAIRTMSLSIASALLYTAPAFVSVMAYFFLGETLTWIKISAVVMAVTGCALISGLIGNTGTASILNILIGLGAGLGYALYSIFGKCAIRKGYSNTTITFYTFLIAGSAVMPWLNTRRVLENIGNHVFVESALLLILLSTLMAFFLYTAGLAKLDTGVASVLSCMEPVVACMVSILCYQESMDAEEWFGLSLIVISAVLSGASGKQKRKEEGDG